MYTVAENGADTASTAEKTEKCAFYITRKSSMDEKCQLPATVSKVRSK